jgi:hypothetical protein
MKRIDESRRGKGRVSPNRSPVLVTGELRPFVGRSRGVIQISDRDLLAPVGDDWKVDSDI